MGRGIHLVVGNGRLGRWLAGGALAANAGLRRAARGFRLHVPERLLIAPQELVAGDPVAAYDICEGQFLLVGRTVQTKGLSVFSVVPPNAEWARALHGFAWLTHFREVEDPAVRAQARAFVGDWMDTRAACNNGSAWLPEVAARRLLSWLSQSPLLLTGADHGFYHRFMRELARTAFHCEIAAGRGSLGLAQLDAAIAYAAYTLCAETREDEWRRGTKLLANALAGTILADGTPVTRNPQDAVTLAADLLPLRTAFTARGRTPPPQLQIAIERLLRFLRLMRHPSGELALFNGMGATEFDTVSALLQFDDARSGAVPVSAPFGGYHRLERGAMTVLVDAGAAPMRQNALKAHAGLASFEVSAAGERVFVNCGAPKAGLVEIRQAVRETAAHNALMIAGESTARFRPVLRADGGRERALVEPRDRPGVERNADGPDDVIVIANDGGLKARGIRHERSLTVASDGLSLRGEDLVAIDPRRSRSGFGVLELRFHLHPAILPEPDVEAGLVRLGFADGSRWEFEAGGLPLHVEESIFFGGLASQRRTRQLVITLPCSDVTIIWSLSRVSGPG